MNTLAKEKGSSASLLPFKKTSVFRGWDGSSGDPAGIFIQNIIYPVSFRFFAQETLPYHAVQVSCGGGCGSQSGRSADFPYAWGVPVLLLKRKHIAEDDIPRFPITGASLLHIFRSLFRPSAHRSRRRSPPAGQSAPVPAVPAPFRSGAPNPPP